MTRDPMKNILICSGLFSFIVSMAALGVVNLCCDFFVVYLSLPLCVLVSLLITAGAVSIVHLRQRVKKLELQIGFLMERAKQ